jgi:hypothetical protein
MEATTKLQQSSPDTQSDLSELTNGMRRLADVLSGLLVERDDNYDEPETHWSESADWQDHLSQYDGKAAL